MLGFLIRASIVALGLWLATVWVSGVSIDTPATLILAGVLLGIVNSPGMHVADFWSAFWTSVLVSLVSFVGSWFVGGKGKVEVIVRRR